MGHVNFKGQPVKLDGKFPNLGDKAPSFKLVDQALKDRDLHEFKGKKILSIVPSLDTPVCLTSAKKMNEFAKKHGNCQILVISTDLPFAQKRICGLEHLDKVTTLSMMRDKKFGQDYGLLIEEGPLKGVLARAILVLDEDDKVIYKQLVDEITHEPDYDAALKSL